VIKKQIVIFTFINTYKKVKEFFLLDDSKVPRELLSKIKLINNDGDNTPLTTKAYRDLQRAQKEKVYKRTLIRVKLVNLFDKFMYR